jgi:hypothetical protein
VQRLAARLGEFRIALVIAAVLGGLLVLAARHAAFRPQLVSSAERARVSAMFDGWLAASRTDRCERPPLREPATGDGGSRGRFESKSRRWSRAESSVMRLAA